MADATPTPRPKASEKTENKEPDTAADAVAEPAIQELHDAVKEAEKVGYLGTPADPTPNEHYTVAGVLDPNKHVPEEFKTQTGVIVYPDDVVAEKPGKKNNTGRGA